jgi:hypothetical protein
VFSLGAIALIAAQFPAWTDSRPGWLGYDRAFRRDDNQELIEWLKTEVPPDAVRRLATVLHRSCLLPIPGLYR